MIKDHHAADCRCRDCTRRMNGGEQVTSNPKLELLAACCDPKWAADEIERLQRELKIQDNANEILTRDVAELKHDNARLYASLTAEVNADDSTLSPKADKQQCEAVDPTASKDHDWAKQASDCPACRAEKTSEGRK